jgi:hypothetical protein
MIPNGLEAGKLACASSVSQTLGEGAWRLAGPGSARSQSGPARRLGARGQV